MGHAIPKEDSPTLLTKPKFAMVENGLALTLATKEQAKVMLGDEMSLRIRKLTLEEYIEVRRAITTRLWFVKLMAGPRFRVEVDEKAQVDYDEQTRILERVIQTKPELIKEKAHGNQVDKQ